MSDHFSFDIILAVDSESGISKNNTIPWEIKEEMIYFRDITTNKTFYNTKNIVIMGYNTWVSIGEVPLINRINIVLTSKNILSRHENLLFCKSFNHAKQLILEIYPTNRNVFIIGGKYLYESVNYHKDLKHIYISEIEDVYDCDNNVNINIKNFGLVNLHTESFWCKNKMKMVKIVFKKYINLHDEIQYLNIMENIMNHGEKKDARNNGNNTISLVGKEMVFDLHRGFPLLTTKKIFIRGVFEELKFFLTGETNVKKLEDKGIKIWSANTNREFLDSVGLHHYKVGDIGTSYSFQFKHYGAKYEGMDKSYDGKGIDQFSNLINDIIKNKYSRRLLMTTFNPVQLHQGPLPPCHGLIIQFLIEKNNNLSCKMYQRSADWVLGVPFNIASYALLLHIIVHIVNNRQNNEHLEVGKLYMTFGDIHIYKQHFEAVHKELNRSLYNFPNIYFKKKFNSIEDLNWEDINIENYMCHPNDLGAIMIA